MAEGDNDWNIDPIVKSSEVPEQSASFPELTAFRSSYRYLVTGIGIDPGTVCDHLVSKNFIPKEVIQMCRNPHISKTDKSRSIVDTMMSHVQTNPSNFHEFMEALKQCGGWMKDCVEKLSRAFETEQERVSRRSISTHKSTAKEAAGQSQVPSFVCPYCENCDLEQYIFQGCPNANGRTLFPYLNTPFLTPEERETLEITLKSQTEDMRDKFAYLQDMVSERLQCNISALKDLIFNHIGSDLLGKEAESKLECANSVSEIFIAIRHYKSFLNYKIVKIIVEKFGCNELRTTMEDYLQEFEVFAKRSVFEIPSCVFMHGRYDKRKIISFKIAEEIDLSYIKTVSFLKNIASILKVNILHLKLCLVDKGCVCLRCLVPSYVVDKVLPNLTTSQLAAFDASNIKILEFPQLSGVTRELPPLDPEACGKESMADISSPVEQGATIIDYNKNTSSLSDMFWTPHISESESKELHSQRLKWTGGGNQVFLSGSFNNWKKTPMFKSRSEVGVFSTSLHLPAGRHEYMFLVDGETMLDGDKERSTNEKGALVNICWIPEVSGGSTAALSLDSAVISGDFPPSISSLPDVTWTPHIDSAVYAESDSDYSTDTESTTSTASSVDLTSTATQLIVFCYQAPQCLKGNLHKHLKLQGVSDVVTNVNTRPRSKMNAIVTISPAEAVNDVISKLHNSMLLGKYKLTVKLKKNKTKVKKDKAIKVFVGSLPKFVTETQLQLHFSSFKDKIAKVEIARDKGKSKGFGFIFFTNRSSANAAVRTMDNTNLQGKFPIKVSLSKQDKTTPPQNMSVATPTKELSTDSPDTCQVFINSKPALPDEITRDQIAQHFSSYKGQFTSVKVIKGKGYVIMTFKDAALAEEAVSAYNGSKLLGVFKLELHCKQKEPKVTISSMKTPGTRRPSSSNNSEGRPQPSPLSPSLVPTYKSCAVKITRLPPQLTREGLAALLRDFGELPKLPKIFETKNRYALANFTTMEDAMKAIQGLDNTVLDGYTIKASLKESQTTKPSAPSQLEPLLAAVPATMATPPIVTTPTPQWIVRVDNLDPLISHTELKAMVSVPVLKMEQVSSSQTVLYFSSSANADKAVQELNGMTLLGKTVQARMQLPSTQKLTRALSEPSSMSYQHSIPPVGPMHPVPTARPTLLHSPISMPCTVLTTPPPPPPTGSGRTLKFTPGDWNRLMTIGPTNRSLYQDITEPYSTNDNVHIEPNMTTHEIRFSGLPEAVASAYGRVCSEVYRELPVSDRLRKISLSFLRPDLPSLLQQKYSVSLTGYNDSPGNITLQGNSTNFALARQELESILNTVRVSEIPMTVSPKLLESARECLRIEHLPVCIYTGPGSLVLYSLTSVERAMGILQSGPFSETINDVSADTYDKVIQTLQSRLVEIERQGSSVILKSFVQHELQNVATHLRAKVESASTQQVPVDASPEDIAYLIHLQKTDHQVREQLSSLPAQFVKEKNLAFLKGTSQAVQAAQSFIKLKILSQVSTRRFVFTAHTKFISQLEEFLLKPVRDEVVWLKQESAVTPRKQRGAGKRRTRSEGDDIQEIGLIICSKHREVFEHVCSDLEAVKPSSKKVTLRKGASESIKLEEIKSDLESKYRVRIISRDDSLNIHGLTPKEVRECETDIKSRVESNHEIAKHLPLTYHQQIFLKTRRRQELEDLKEECSELHILPPNKDHESHSVRIKGTVKKVEAVYEQVAEIVNSLISSKIELPYERRFHYMWKRRWDQIKRDRERSSDIVIDVSNETGRPSIPKQHFTTTTIHIVGTDTSKVDEISLLLTQMQTQSKTLSLTPKAAELLKKDKKEFLQPLAVNFFIKYQSGKPEVELTAPEDCTDDLETAEEEVQKFLGERTVSSKALTSSEEVVGLVLNSRAKAASYLALANEVSRKYEVKVQVLKKPQSGLRISGTQSAIQAAEKPLFSQVIQPIQSSIGKDQLKVKSMFKSVLSTSSFLQFTSKLQDELCVIVTAPRSTKPNQVLRSTMIQPSSSARCLKLEISRGTLVIEETDAIVNAANEDLQHIGGLAKAILDAGGPSIQAESNEYVQERGKVRAGNVVILGAGKLPCRAVIHAVGPRWEGGAKGEESNLYLTVLKSLMEASGAGYGSISLPAISTGIFSVPVRVCAKASLKAVRDFCQSHPTSCLHTVRFVLFTQQEVDEFCSHFDSDASLRSSQQQSVTSPLTSNPTTFSSTTTTPTGAWLWMNDLGTLTPYASDMSKQLSSAYSANSNGNVILTINGTQYSVDFPTMLQTNVRTGHRRSIKFDPSLTSPGSSNSARWYYRDDTRGFSPYQLSESQKIETMYRNGVPGLLQIGSSMYTFDFASMCQINTATNYKRPIQRREDSPVSVSSSQVTKPPAPTAPPSPQRDICVTLRGPRDSLEAAKEKLQKKLNNYIQKDTVKGGFTFPAEFSRKIEDIAKKHRVNCVIESEGGAKKQSVVRLEGINNDVQATVKAMQQLIIDHQVSSQSEGSVEAPPDWEVQARTVEVFQVQQGTAEWSRVELKFKATLSANQIVSISRIQNTWLWENYCTHKKRLHVKNNGAVNEMELFHGTRANDPKLIYETENGFDMRYSNRGMWGTANYFAVNASYSYNYAYQTPDGYKEMFLVKVLTGDSYRCAPDANLRKPPEKSSLFGGGKLQFSKMDYDSVTGDTHGSQVFMTYDNDKSYPAYLIKFR